MRGAPVRRWISAAGLDVVRDPDGRFLVLEDQVRMPAGLAYAVVARETLRDLLPVAPPQADHSPAFGELALALRDAAPEGVDEPERRAPLRGPERGRRGGSTSDSLASYAPPRSRSPISITATTGWWPGSTGARAPWTWSITAPTRTASAERRSEPRCSAPAAQGRWRA